MSHELTRTNARAKGRRPSLCPAKLEEIIDLVKLVPPGINLPNPMTLFTANPQAKSAVDKARDIAEGLLGVREALREDVLEPLFHRSGSSEREQQWYLDYWTKVARKVVDEDRVESFLISTALNLLNLAVSSSFLPRRRIHDWKTPSIDRPLDELLTSILSKPILILNLTRLAELYALIWRVRGVLTDIASEVPTYRIDDRYSINESGCIVIAKDIFDDAIDGVRAARIRRCPICERVFWADRKDQVCCTRRCNHIRQSRLSRRKKALNRRATDQHNLSEVRKAIERGSRTPEAISVTTALPLDEANRLINLLTNRGEADWNARQETLYLKDSAKKGK
jgi:hypothetical protein